MKLSRKLMIAPLVAIGFLVALALAGFYALTLQQDAADSFYQGTFSRFESAADTETTVGKVHAGIRLPGMYLPCLAAAQKASAPAVATCG